MATTSKPNRRKRVVKKQPTKKQEQEKVEVLDTLDIHDLRLVEKYANDVNTARLEMHVQEQVVNNITLQLESLHLKLEKQKELLKIRADMYDGKKKVYREFKQSIEPKYGLKEGEPLGYHPDTGDIVR